MHGSGTFFDARLNNAEQYPVAAKSGSGNTRGKPDLVTAKLAALHFYHSLSRHRSPRMVVLFWRHLHVEKQSSMARQTAPAATCSRFSLSRETIFTLPVRSASIRGKPTDHRRTCTAPRRSQVCGAIERGGFYHDGRFATLPDVIEHYDGFFKLRLTDREKRDLTEYLKSL